MDEKTESSVNHPAHYTQLPHEVIEITRGMEFRAGNVIKYLMRAPFKGQMLEDLEKARWYAEDIIKQGKSIKMKVRQRTMAKENAEALARMGFKGIENAIFYATEGRIVAARTYIECEIEDLKAIAREDENDKA